VGHSEVPSPSLSALPRLAIGHVDADITRAKIQPSESTSNGQASELNVRSLARERLRIIGGETGIGLGR